MAELHEARSVALEAPLLESAHADPEPPGPQPTLDDMLADIERQRLFRIIEDLVLWENTTNETVLQAARCRSRRSGSGSRATPAT